jgi:hypothetical protein
VIAALSNLLQMLRSGVPRSFGFAIGLAVLTVRDNVRFIVGNGFFFIASEENIPQSVHLAMQSKLVVMNFI